MAIKYFESLKFHELKKKLPWNCEKFFPDGEMTFSRVLLADKGLVDIGGPQPLASAFEKLQRRQTRSNVILRLFAQGHQGRHVSF
jgi:hypothetical protein